MKKTPLLWYKEYQHTGIPSSFLKNPSGALNLLYDYLEKQKTSLAGKTAADLGCGRGRNTFSLLARGAQKVYALDFVPQVIEAVEEETKGMPYRGTVEAICHDLTKPWPIVTNILDLIIDIFTFKHQTDPKKLQFYKAEIKRTLKSGGLLLLSLAAVDDDYYGNFPKIQIKNNVFKVKDPATDVGSLIYTKESLLAEFDDFDVLDFRNDKKEGQMYGKTYLRSILKFLLQKK